MTYLRDGIEWNEMEKQDKIWNNKQHNNINSIHSQDKNQAEQSSQS